MAEAVAVSETNMKNLYWNIRQQLVHHAVTGCVMRAGDLLGTGTISGSTDGSLGSMLELSWRGSRQVIARARAMLVLCQTATSKGKKNHVYFAVCCMERLHVRESFGVWARASSLLAPVGAWYELIHPQGR